jgi:hypothetical protein
MTKGTTVETPQGIGTVAGTYESEGKTICVVKLRDRTEAFLAAKLTVVETATTAREGRHRCEAFLEGKDRRCRNWATFHPVLGWTCDKHAKQ